MFTARRLSLAVSSALVVAALAAAPSGAATLSPTVSPYSPTAAPAPTTQGIIMSDGRICNPRWGC